MDRKRDGAMTNNNQGEKMKYLDSLVDISKIPKGTILRDWHDGGVRIVVLRSTFSMNVYLGVPTDHPLAGFGYDDIPLDCHGGLTFSSEGTDKILPKGYYWYGYDYAHSGDYAWYDSGTSDFIGENDKKWSLKEIVDDAWSPIYEFKKLIKLAERIKSK